MKELENRKHETVSYVHTQVASRKMFEGSLKRYPGQAVFQMDLNTGKISLAKFDEVQSDIKGNALFKIIMKPGHLYCTAINETNAARKFIKMATKK